MRGGHAPCGHAPCGQRRSWSESSARVNCAGSHLSHALAQPRASSTARLAAVKQPDTAMRWHSGWADCSATATRVANFVPPKSSSKMHAQSRPSSGGGTERDSRSASSRTPTCAVGKRASTSDRMNAAASWSSSRMRIFSQTSAAKGVLQVRGHQSLPRIRGEYFKDDSSQTAFCYFLRRIGFGARPSTQRVRSGPRCPNRHTEGASL